MGKARRVAFGKAVIAKPLDLVEAPFGEILRIAARGHAADHLVLERADRAAPPERRHGAAQFVRLVAGELRGHHGKAHGLFLEQRHAHGLAEHLMQFVPRPVVRMGRGERDLLLAGAAAQIRMHHVALDRARAHDSDLDDEVVETARLEARQHVHLRAALHLEHTDGVRAAEHVVYGRILPGHGAERELRAVMLLQKREGLADAGQHAEAQHIDLEQTQRVEIVLVPLDDGAVFHGRVADGHEFGQGAARQHEAAHMLRQMPGKADQLMGQRKAAGETRVRRVEPRLAHIFVRKAFIAETPDRAGEGGDRVFREPQHFADLAHGRAAPIRDDGGGQPCAVAAVARVDILNYLLAALVFEVHIDIGRLAAFGRHETLEQKIDLGGIDIGDGEAIAHGGIGGRAAPLAENADGARVMHDVVDGQKIRRVGELLDEREFLLDRAADAIGDAVREAPGCPFPGQRFQMSLRCLAFGNRLVRIFVFQLVEREAARVRDLDRAFQRVFITFEEPGHFGRRLQMPLRIGLKTKSCLAKRTFFANAGEHVLERATFRRMIEHGAGGDERDAGAGGERCGSFDPYTVIAAIAVMRGEIERRLQGAFEAQELFFEADIVRVLLAPECDKDQSRRMRRHVVEREKAFAFSGAALAKREKRTQSAIGRAGRGVGEKRRGVL